MSVNFLHRGLAAKETMSVEAGNYERSTAGIVLEVIVGLLTAGIGAVGFEVYHAVNKANKSKEFASLAGELLKGMQNTSDEGYDLKIPWQGSTIEVIPCNGGIKITFGEQERIIENKKLSEVRENLKKDIVSSPDVYGATTVKMALQDKTGDPRSLVEEFLRPKTSSTYSFDHLETRELVTTAIDVIEGNLTDDKIEEALNPNNEVISKDILALIDKWQNSPADEKAKIDDTNKVNRPSTVSNRAEQTADEKKYRHFFAELLFPGKSWEADTIPQGARLKQVLIENAELIAELPARLHSSPSFMQDYGFPEDLNNIVQSAIAIPGILENYDKDTVVEALNSLPDKEYDELYKAIDQQLTDYQFTPPGGVDVRSVTAGVGSDNLQKFLENVFKNYFDRQCAIDKRAMLASWLENSGFEDRYEVQLIALLKGGGPYLQKLLQLVGDNATGELKDALDELKTNLNPINENMVKAILAGIIGDSDGAIEKIEVIDNLGAASVGQTVLANLHWQGKSAPQEVVVKILRPEIHSRAARELKFFKEEAQKIPGMSKTFHGIAQQIKAEMDLTHEAEYVRKAHVYGKKYPNLLQPMKLVEAVPASKNYMILEKAPGITVKSVLDNLKKYILNSDTAAICAELARGIKALTTIWVEEALFGSGYYHGDLHAGNIMFFYDKKTGTGMTTVIDMGNAAIMSFAQRKAVFKIVLAAGVRDPDILAHNYEVLLSDDGKNS